jgi:2-polyprenyl-6-methoxyphenol hydroxylase-like FAD-dependent oxidoreductase
MIPSETDILIVGAGPTGLALAISLRQAGLAPLVVDRLPAGLNASRAAVIHAHTLDVLDTIGVADALAARGLKLPAFSIREHDRALVTLPFDTLPGAHPYLLMIPQDATEAALAARFAALGGTVRRGTTATGFAREGDLVRVTLATPDGERSLRARHVVGADGMHSAVRAAAGIAFDGVALDESFVLADVRMDWPPGAREVALFFSPDGLLVVAPLPDGSYRLVAPVANAPERPDETFMQALLDARGPEARPGRIDRVVWGSRFRVHHRLASAYRAGPYALVGDAAHVHSPAGGQGMNCGLVDACMLGRLLADVLQGKRPEADLALYEKLRRPAAARVLALAGRLTSVATIDGAFARGARNALLSAAFGLAPVRRRLTMELSGLARAELARLPEAA